MARQNNDRPKTSTERSRKHRQKVKIDQTQFEAAKKKDALRKTEETRKAHESCGR